MNFAQAGNFVRRTAGVLRMLTFPSPPAPFFAKGAAAREATVKNRIRNVKHLAKLARFWLYRHRSLQVKNYMGILQHFLNL